MSHESPAFKRISRAPEKADDFATTEPWRVQAGEPEFPVLLKDPPHSARWQSVHGIGSREIPEECPQSDHVKRSAGSSALGEYSAHNTSSY